MELKTLQLTDYRNYADQLIQFAPGINVLAGDNAQGKTNVLESIRLCSIGRSHRTTRDRELIMDGRERATLRMSWQRRDGSHELIAVLPNNAPKQLRVDGKLLRRSGELMGQLPTVLFAPEDLMLVKAGPVERRRFIDMELSQLRPKYYYSLQRYNKALKQRNNLLKLMQEQPELGATLEDWDSIICEEGAVIITMRHEFTQRINEYAARRHAHISGGEEQLRCSYQTCVEPSNAREELISGLKRSRARDTAAGTSTFGPHRDDLLMEINERDARVFASQGQQRTIALSLKLSELELMREETGEWPLLLLDDVMSELDPARRRLLLECIAGAQTIVTCTNSADLAGAQAERIMQVRAGTITQCN